MKYKKIFLILIITLFMGCSEAYAEELNTLDCYYIGDKFKATLKIKSGYDSAWLHGLEAYAKLYIDENGSIVGHNREPINNWWANLKAQCIASNTTCFDPIYRNSAEANAEKNLKCPKYLVMQDGTDYKEWVTDDLNKAKKAVNEINQYKPGKYYGYYATFTNSNGTTITKDQYYDLIESDIENGTIVNVDNCETLFGSSEDENSIRSILDEILQYVRWAVPIMVLTLGIVDFFKATIAGKEDEMTKAKKTFIKRIIAGVAVFFVPVLVDLIMSFADIVWEGLGYTHCGL